jgi:NADP-dependent aldehyde dehydrogenase
MMLDSVDPRDGTVRGRVPVTPPEEIARVCAAAGAAFAEGEPPPAVLAAVLRSLGDALTGARGELVALADEETALGPARLDGELDRAAFQLRAFGDLVGDARLREVDVDTADLGRVPPRAEQRSALFPLGPVAVFAASNFPFAFGVLGGDTASALAAGCPVIVKAHPAQPRLGARLAELAAEVLRQAGCDPRWLAVVADGGTASGEVLVGHPAVAAVGFTGGFAGGRALVAAAAARPVPIPVHAEMGSLNPVFVGPAAARERAQALAEEWAGVLTAGSGQLCTKPGLLVLPGAGPAARAAARAREVVRSAGPLPMLTARMRDGVRRGVERALAVPGVAGPPVDVAADGAWSRATVLTASARTVLAHPHLAEEVFGPVGMVVACDGPEEVRELAAALPGSLTASVHADEADAAWVRGLLPVLRRMAGRLVYGGWPTGVSIGWATVHGGPWPATNAPAATSVGFHAARRFLRPVAWQGFPPELLPEALR